MLEKLGGICNKHGAYTGEECPKWPDCATPGGLDMYHVGRDFVGDIMISTVYLGVAYPKELGQYETMIFGGKYDHAQWRYNTLEKARHGHSAAVTLVRGPQNVTEEKKVQALKEVAERKKPELPIRSISFEDDK